MIFTLILFVYNKELQTVHTNVLYGDISHTNNRSEADCSEYYVALNERPQDEICDIWCFQNHTLYNTNELQ